jgi:hypothetical protein
MYGIRLNNIITERLKNLVLTVLCFLNKGKGRRERERGEGEKEREGRRERGRERERERENVYEGFIKFKLISNK